jgi:hypothetical protein
MMASIARLWHLLVPPRMSSDTVARIQIEAEQTTKQAHNIADALDGVIETARADHTDPLAVLIRKVKSASFRDEMMPPQLQRPHRG